jgi:hypothetical protein
MLSVMVTVIVILSLITPAISMTGELVCTKEEHTHTDDCYTKTLICTEDTTSHQHSDDCYTETSVLTCDLEEDENHTHSEQCYTTEKVLTCDIPETTEHIHSDECYEYKLNCNKEEHTHTDECYKNSPSETESTDTSEAEETIETTESNQEQIIELDPIDAEKDAVLNSVRKKSVRSVYTYSAYGNTTIISSSSIDFGTYIKSVTHKDVAGATNEPDVKTVKFTINYNLPAGTISESNENHQIYCQLPENVVIPELKTGIVRKEGQEIGTYTITDDGYIIIEFDQNFVKDGSTAILGDISFNANVLKTSTESNYETVTIGAVSVNIPFPTSEVPVISNDLSIGKSFVGYDRTTKKVTYKMEIKSYNGSGDGDITVTDMLYYTDSSLIHLDWTDGATVTFTKKDSSANTSDISAQVSVDADGKATITGLPKLNANESYTLEYTATLTPDGHTQIIKTNNKATVSNGTLSDDAVYYGETAVSCGISKKGQYNDRRDRIEWTITITNPFGDSLNGYTITDDMLGITIDGLKLKTANGTLIETLDDSNSWTGTTGSLDKATNTFSFDSSANGNGYILSYETPLPDRSAIANNTISNKAILKSEGTEINAPIASPYIGSDRKYLNKYCRSSSYNSDGNVIMAWYASLDFQMGDFNGQIYTDTMSSDGNYHYMTPLQKDSLSITGYKADSGYTEVSLTNGTDYTVKWYNIDGNEVADETENVYSFEITFADNSTISELSDIDIYYSATGITENMANGSERVFTNKAQFLDTEHTSSFTERKKEPFYK